MADIYDDLLAHHIMLTRYGETLGAEAIAILEQATAALEAQTVRRLGWLASKGYSTSDFTLRRLEANLRELRAIIRGGYTAAGRHINRELKKMSKAEVAWAAKTFGSATHGVGVGLPPPHVINNILESSPIQGTLLRNWASVMGQTEYKQFERVIRTGMLNGDSIQKMTRDLFGSRATGPGALASWRRRDVVTWTRTATLTIANDARNEVWVENRDLIEAIEWVSTLDSRTTPMCQIRDGKLYDPKTFKPVGHGIPWKAGPGGLHFNCRSTSAPVTDLSERGDDGRPPFSQWIRNQPEKVQIAALGRQRARLLKQGLSFDKMFSNAGVRVPLRDLYASLAGLPEFEALLPRAFRGTAPIAPGKWGPVNVKEMQIYGLPEELAEFEKFGLTANEFAERMVQSDGFPVGTKFIGSMEMEGDYGWRINGRWEHAGQQLGTMDRSGEFATVEIARPTGTVNHEYLKLDSGRQGAGATRSLIRNQMTLYEQMKVHSVKVHANIDVGGYAWSRYGAVMSDESAFYDLAQDVEWRWKKMVADGADDAISPAAKEVIDDFINMGNAATFDDAESMRMIWQISDLAEAVTWGGKTQSLGKHLLLNSDWHGVFDMTDLSVMERLWAYVGRK